MPEIRKKEMDFLGGEIAGWVEEGIITGEQATEILSLYEIKARNLRVIMLIAEVYCWDLGQSASFSQTGTRLIKIFA